MCLQQTKHHFHFNFPVLLCFSLFLMKQISGTSILYRYTYRAATTMTSMLGLALMGYPVYKLLGYLMCIQQTKCMWYTNGFMQHLLSMSDTVQIHIYRAATTSSFLSRQRTSRLMLFELPFSFVADFTHLQLTTTHMLAHE